ncbi:Serine/threonine/tyrosine-interacting protein [Choanephora cucurbitarum]|uniref:Serine/threonine/tyrosine-interacting protein n=1 Tax=Choanephora cucurbitarum TaxID=101091 RepID=A0A1C7NRV2_9FUNG|nr:Serine/threonine/tyrosine-interacting protein [Choanephora cucurbitarum]
MQYTTAAAISNILPEATYSKDLFANAQGNMDDWRYEMRREIQEIVPGLFLGPFSACRQVEKLKQLGITHIACFVDETEARLFRTENLTQFFEYQQFIITDSNLQNLIQYFPQTSHYFHHVISGLQSKILVCCNGGMSRSPTFVIAYIMEVFRIDASQAYHYVQGKRLCINPNDGFKSQLKEYEPIYRARQLGVGPTFEEERQQRRRRRSDPEEDEEIGANQNPAEVKRFFGLEEQQQNGNNANVNAGYSSTLL